MSETPTRVMLGIVIVGLLAVGSQLYILNDKTAELLTSGKAIEKDVETANANMEILEDAANTVGNLQAPLQSLNQRGERFDTALSQIELVDGKFTALEKNVKSLLPVAEALRGLGPKLEGLDQRVASFESAVEEVRGLSAASQTTVDKLDQGLVEMQNLRSELKPLKDLSIALSEKLFAPVNETANSTFATSSDSNSSYQDGSPEAEAEEQELAESEAPCQTWTSAPAAPGYPPQETYTECKDGSKTTCKFVGANPAKPSATYECTEA